MLETKLGLGCAVHFAAGLGGFSFVDLDPHLSPDRDPFSRGPEFSEPHYSLSRSEAGIGVIKK
jgi:L-Ala-D/L-Glu epimerase